MSSNRGDDLVGTRVVQLEDTNRFKYYRVQSGEAVSGANYSFNMLFGNDVRMDQVIAVGLDKVIFQNGMPNVSAIKGNASFTYEGNSIGLQTVNVASGYYTTATLMTALQTALNASLAGVGTTYTITQNAITNLITFTRTAGGEFLRFLKSPQNAMGSTLGIMADSGFVSAFTTTSAPDLTGEKVVYLHSAEIAPNLTYIGTNGQVSDVNGAFTIPITVPIGQYQTYLGVDSDRIIMGRHGRPIRGFNFTLRGYGGRILSDMPANAVVIIVLKLFYN